MIEVESIPPKENTRFLLVCNFSMYAPNGKKINNTHRVKIYPRVTMYNKLKTKARESRFHSFLTGVWRVKNYKPWKNQ